ncbi:MAG: rhodanese-like domain-containing protein [Planctomycetaceae bacterium]
MTPQHLFRLGGSTLLLLTLLLTSCQAAEHTTDSLVEVKQALKDGKAVLIDLREQDEWNAGHLKAATLVPLSRLPKLAASGELSQQVPKEKVVYGHCAAGRRVLKAAQLLRQQGYDYRPLKQGYEDLLKAGFEPAKTN